ncbi:hypothetical protein [Thermaerobacter litoralis]
MSRLTFRARTGLGVDFGTTGVRWARWSPRDGLQVVSGRQRGPVVASVPAEETILRVMPTPPVPRRELPAALRWELQRILPYPVEEAAFDFVTLPGPGNYQMDGPDHPSDDLPSLEGVAGYVVVSGAPVEVLEARTRQLVQHGVRPAALEPEWVTLWRIARFFQLLDESPAACAVIDLGHTSARFLVLGADGIPAAFHRSASGGQRIETELAGQLGVTTAQLHTLRLGELRDDSVTLSGTAAVTELIGDVTRLLRRARRETGMTSTGVWAIGGGAAWPALVKALSEAADIEILVPGTGSAQEKASRFHDRTVPGTGGQRGRWATQWATDTAVALTRCPAPSVVAAGLALWHANRWAAAQGLDWLEPLSGDRSQTATPGSHAPGVREVGR